MRRLPSWTMAAKLLDLFCGAGGAAYGYQQAGFSVVGVDHRPQPGYVGDEFVQADAFEFLAQNWWKFDAIHASPPCQRYSPMTRCRPGLHEQYPDHIPRLRAWLDYYAKPYVIENVPRAPLRNPTMLCGTMFGFELYRHRLFETNFRIKQLSHPFHRLTAVHPDEWEPGKIMSVVGNCSPIEHARRIMDIPWMSAEALSEAVPPYYTAYVGQALRRRLDRLARLAS
jgi:DNA (cytosine-5)-methyltransferase 1